MKLSFVLIAVVVALGLVSGTPARSGVQRKPCLKSCTLDYTPICAGDNATKEKPKSFGSVCVLDNFNCEHGTNLKKLSDGECPGGGGVRLS